MVFRGYTILASTNTADIGWLLIDVKVVELLSDVAMDVELGPSSRCLADVGDITCLLD